MIDKMRVDVIICVLFLVALLILSVFATLIFLYVWSNVDDTDEDWDHCPIKWDLEDGNNTDEEHGCFFTLKALVGPLPIDPKQPTFYVYLENQTPRRLDFNIRTYDNEGNPLGGDRNGTYDYTSENHTYDRWITPSELLDKSETIGFDMPKKEMGIEIKEGELYNVEIENKEGELIYRGCFRYTCDGCS